MAKKVIYRGKEYQSIRELSKDTGTAYHIIAKRLTAGMTVEEAVETEVKEMIKPVIYKSREFRSLAELSQHLGINYGVLQSRMKRYGSVEEALEKPVQEGREPKEIVYQG